VTTRRDRLRIAVGVVENAEHPQIRRPVGRAIDRAQPLRAFGGVADQLVQFVSQRTVLRLLGNTRVSVGKGAAPSKQILNASAEQSLIGLRLGQG